MGDAYTGFLAAKAITDPMTGLPGPFDLAETMFPFQRDLTQWALNRGRAGLFAGTGLGKTLMELAWAQEVMRETKRPLLHLAPLAVTAQIEREGAKFGIKPGTLTNYQKLSHFDLSEFGGVVLDESSILKSVDGHYRTRLIEECAQIPFRLAATATPSPNDFMELGNHAEFLGIMSYTDMLATFFVHDGGDTQKWRLKGHAENEFWKWMASWSVMLRKPSDLGYSDDGYDLPPLTYHQHIIEVEHNPATAGTLFAMEAQGLSGRITARRESIQGRVERACDITSRTDSFAWWCNLNAEADFVAKNIPGAFNLHGGLTEDEKERAILGYLDGSIRVLVSKPSICGFGMNFQHCHKTGFVGLNDSFEQYYQAVRRFWRFGQTQAVDCHLIAAQTEGAVVANIRRKEADMERMAASMVMHTRDMSALAVRGQVRDTPLYNPQTPMRLPHWLENAA